MITYRNTPRSLHPIFDWMLDGSRFNASAGSNTSNFMAGEFNTILHMTVKCIHGILSEGYNVFFTDVDVAWLRDPIPYFQL